MINVDEALAVPSAGKRTLNELRALVQHALELQAQIEEHGVSTLTVIRKSNGTG